jgi:hypothetical protein
MSRLLFIFMFLYPAAAFAQLPVDTATTTNTSTSTASGTTTSATPPSTSTLSTATAPSSTTLTATSTATQAAGDAAKASDARLKELLTVTPHLGLKGKKMTCQLASAVSALQVNLKTMDWERVAMMMGWGCTYRSSVPFGAAVYIGLGLSKSHPNAFQTSVLFSLFDWGTLGPGVQIFKDPSNGSYVWQGLLTLALNLNIGVSVDTLLKLVQTAKGNGQ